MIVRERLLAALSERADAALDLPPTVDIEACGLIAWREAFDLVEELTRPGAAVELGERLGGLAADERTQLLADRAEALDLAGQRALRIVELEAQLGAALRALRAGVEGMLNISRLALVSSGQSQPVGGQVVTEWPL